MDKQNLTTDRTSTTTTGTTATIKKYSVICNTFTENSFFTGNGDIAIYMSESKQTGKEIILTGTTEETENNIMIISMNCPIDFIKKSALYRLYTDDVITLEDIPENKRDNKLLDQIASKTKYPSSLHNNNLESNLYDQKVFEFINVLYTRTNKAVITFTLNNFIEFSGINPTSPKQLKKLSENLHYSLSKLSRVHADFVFYNKKTKEKEPGAFNYMDVWNKKNHVYNIKLGDGFKQFMDNISNRHVVYYPYSFMTIEDRNVFNMIRRLQHHYQYKSNIRTKRNFKLEVGTILKYTNLATNRTDDPKFRPNDRLRKPLMRILEDASRLSEGGIKRYIFKDREGNKYEASDTDKLTYNEWQSLILYFALDCDTVPEPNFDNEPNDQIAPVNVQITPVNVQSDLP